MKTALYILWIKDLIIGHVRLCREHYPEVAKRLSKSHVKLIEEREIPEMDCGCAVCSDESEFINPEYRDYINKIGGQSK